MDWFRKAMPGWWGRTSGRATKNGAPSDRELAHRKARKKMKQELKEDQE